MKTSGVRFGGLAWVILFGWATLFLLTGKPALMVILGGIATVVILLIVVFAAIFFRYRKLELRLLPTRIYDATLWVSSIAIVAVAGYLAFQTADLAFQTVANLIGE
ncbi:MAG: hypothetical protein P8L85_22430 [Rubripirellula sp.]|nr:hypothetical protein [Rubripirellula sp.]